MPGGKNKNPFTRQNVFFWTKMTVSGKNYFKGLKSLSVPDSTRGSYFAFPWSGCWIEPTCWPSAVVNSTNFSFSCESFVKCERSSKKYRPGIDCKSNRVRAHFRSVSGRCRVQAGGNLSEIRGKVTPYKFFFLREGNRRKNKVLLTWHHCLWSKCQTQRRHQNGKKVEQIFRHCPPNSAVESCRHRQVRSWFPSKCRIRRNAYLENDLQRSPVHIVSELPKMGFQDRGSLRHLWSCFDLRHLQIKKGNI